MSKETMLQILTAIKTISPKVADITGGAPEMNPHFKWFCSELIKAGLQVQVRTNLTVLALDAYTSIIDFYIENKIKLIASLPCYTEANVTKQRGGHVFEESIDILKILNKKGYGVDPDLIIDLVYNPGGPFLPPQQQKLEVDYKDILKNEFNIHFNALLTITNVLIGRFKKDLEKSGQHEDYANLLYDAFNPSTVEGLMCRNQINISWDGTIYDCDFNLALSCPVSIEQQHISNINYDSFMQRRIFTGDHCYACTAGSGSSCSGSISP